MCCVCLGRKVGLAQNPFYHTTFTLCKTYAETQNKNKCIHNNSERSFIGTWTTDEVNKAIDKGYKILKVYETWHFDKTSDNLFKGYIRRFRKI